jgi:hypothetical protein
LVAYLNRKDIMPISKGLDGPEETYSKVDQSKHAIQLTGERKGKDELPPPSHLHPQAYH